MKSDWQSVMAKCLGARHSAMLPQIPDITMSDAGEPSGIFLPWRTHKSDVIWEVFVTPPTRQFYQELSPRGYQILQFLLPSFRHLQFPMRAHPKNHPQVHHKFRLNHHHDFVSKVT
uniref:Uncharacterized protein n=1 Tax=Tetranychus urticae TaxID=32264 RepID=T1JS35_TETUR